MRDGREIASTVAAELDVDEVESGCRGLRKKPLGLFGAAAKSAAFGSGTDRRNQRSSFEAPAKRGIRRGLRETVEAQLHRGRGRQIGESAARLQRLGVRSRREGCDEKRFFGSQDQNENPSGSGGVWVTSLENPRASGPRWAGGAKRGRLSCDARASGARRKSCP